MDNITGLLVALMFVTLLTIGFGNILSEVASRLKASKDLADHRLQATWWAILTLIVLDTFWRCAEIFSVETWTFAEFLYILLGAIFLFFASTALPSDTLPDRNPVFFLCLTAFQVWILGLAIIFGSPGLLALLVAVVMLLLLVAVQIRPEAKVYKAATIGMAGLTLVGLFL